MTKIFMTQTFFCVTSYEQQAVGKSGEMSQRKGPMVTISREWNLRKKRDASTKLGSRRGCKDVALGEWVYCMFDEGRR